MKFINIGEKMSVCLTMTAVDFILIIITESDKLNYYFLWNGWENNYWHTLSVALLLSFWIFGYKKVHHFILLCFYWFHINLNVYVLMLFYYSVSRRNIIKTLYSWERLNSKRKKNCWNNTIRVHLFKNEKSKYFVSHINLWWINIGL